MERTQLEASIESQVVIWEHLFGFVESMALKCAVELLIADIIHSHGAPMALPQIASSLDSAAAPDIPYLARIMRLLVRKKIFTSHPSSNGGETLYGLTDASKWLIHGSQYSLAPMVTIQNHPLLLDAWHYSSHCVRDGGIAFNKAHGCDVWEFASRNPEFNKMLNDAMACTVKIITDAILSEYKDGFGSIGSLVDVGGGTGGAIAEIVKTYPHIKGINFDLPHVISTAPEHPGVTHVGGNMFETIPSADAVFMKWVLHDWSDEHCVNILKNCKKAVAGNKGKVIIVDIVLEPEGDAVFDETRISFDLVMMLQTIGGKERTEQDWKKLLEKAGYSRYNIIKIPAIPSIIEAYPF